MTAKRRRGRPAVTPRGLAVEIVASEQFMWLMAGSEHSESHCAALRDIYAAYIKAGGRTYGKT